MKNEDVSNYNLEFPEQSELQTTLWYPTVSPDDVDVSGWSASDGEEYGVSLKTQETVKRRREVNRLRLISKS